MTITTVEHSKFHISFTSKEATGRSNSSQNQSVNIPKTSSFLSTDCRKIQLFYKPNNLRKRFVQFPPLQTASEEGHKLCKCHCATFKRFNVSIFFAKLSTIAYLTNQSMMPESGITRQRHSKNVHRLPFFLSHPHTALRSPSSPIFLFALYPTWEPVHRLELLRSPDSVQIVCCVMVTSTL